MSAASKAEALGLLTQRSLFPLKVEVEAAPANVFGGKRVKPQLLATTYGQLSDLLRSGVPLLRSLQVLHKQSSHAGLKTVLEQLRNQVEDGSSLADAMQRHPRVFSEMAVSMVRAGGEGGFLEDALEQVSVFTQNQEDLKGRTIGAIAYPAFLGVVGTCVVFVLVVFFVPKFATLFERLREQGELPAITEWLLWTSTALRTWALPGIVVLALAGIYAKRFVATERGRVWKDGLKLKLPGVGKILQSLAVARFCRVLGTLLKNGVPIIKSLDISREATGNRVLSVAISNAAENVQSGETLAAPLSASGHFPPNVVEMISVAEEANSLETVLVNIADSLEKRTWRQLELFVRLLEPLMLLILAGVVLVVVIALLLPIIKMSTTV